MLFKMKVIQIRRKINCDGNEQDFTDRWNEWVVDNPKKSFEDFVSEYYWSRDERGKPTGQIIDKKYITTKGDTAYIDYWAMFDK